MPRSFEGDLSASGLRLGVIASRFRRRDRVRTAGRRVTCLARHGAGDDAITVYRVPGAFEIPMLAANILDGHDAVIALGCLIKGDTPHFDFISAQVTNDLSRVSIESHVPIAFGVITCNTLQQAVERSSPGTANKGWEAALAAIEMANLWRALRTEDTF